MTAMKLYRATMVERPHFGHGSFWARDPDHARRYLMMPGFGGPALYCAEVEPESVLDLRIEPWRVLAAEFALDREDYGAGELDHELIWSLSHVLAAGGYDWAILAVTHPTGTHDEWLYLGNTDLTAVPLP